MLKTIEALTEQIRAYDHLIDQLASRYPASEVLSQVTGVGTLTAVALALTLGDPSRFGSSRDVGASRPGAPPARLGQSRFTAFDHESRQHATSTVVGWQCALHPGRSRAGLRSTTVRGTADDAGPKDAKKRALVAVASKLAVLLHRLWINGEVYDPLHSEREDRQAT